MLLFHSQPIEEVLKSLNANVETGHSRDTVKSLIEKHGENKLKEKKKKSTFSRFVDQFKDVMIIILIIAAIISFAVVCIEKNWGELFEPALILVIVLLNAVMGVYQEGKAEKALDALKNMSAPHARVIRDGIESLIDASGLVPGDIIKLEAGDFVPADARLIHSVSLKSEESALTGESLAVEKEVDKIDEKEVGVGDRTHLLFSSSLITYGRGKGIVVETGMNTEVGKIATMINETEEGETPLQAKLNSLGKILGCAALVICVIIFIVGLVYGKEPVHMFMSAVSLAVAAIPEGLAAVSTIVLAIGVQRMVKKNAIVKKLPAVETLGCATVICSDKTGTLTQNKMTVMKLFYNSNLQDLDKIKTIDKEGILTVEALMLCNDTKLADDGSLAGDPTETALIDMAKNMDYVSLANNAGVSSNGNYDPREEYQRVAEIPFDSDRKLMTTVNKYAEDKYIVYTKGGVDELLKCCKAYRLHDEVKTNLGEYIPTIQECNAHLAEDALRVLAVGYKELDHAPSAEEVKNLESDLIFVGMVAMIDPPRVEVKAAVEKCISAGIKTVMITGDHKITATAIAKSLGILQEGDRAITGADLEAMSDEELIKEVRNISVYARVSPEHKVRIVKAWQANGEIVAMTGDGVNDAPALKTADIGCAMGIVGTDVSKEAADVILTDDNFATIVSAVEEGRRIYDNILKAIQFLLSSNIGEIIVLFTAILLTPVLMTTFGIPDELVNSLEPLLPVQILWINLVTDSLPALALAVDPAQKGIMKRKPLKTKGIFTKGMTWRVLYQGVMVGLLTLTAFVLGLATEGVSAAEKIAIGQTMAFSTLALSELVHVFNVRDNKKSMFSSNPFNNGMLLLAIGASALLMFVVLLVPQLQSIFSITNLFAYPEKLLEVVGLVFAPLVIVELFKLLKINTIKEN